VSDYHATVAWDRAGATFTDQRYSRGHAWLFDGGVEVPASASPQVVPSPMSVAAAVDPEEAFVASLSICHMLFFLSLAAKQGFVVDDYRDEAVGTMARNAAGSLAMTRVTLRPRVRYSGEKRPSRAEEDALHHAAHGECFIASSVRTEVACEPVRPPD
jgi:organic hydroperoxide reductase OsmC/OhrA